jgi:hypothetical protein
MHPNNLDCDTLEYNSVKRDNINLYEIYRSLKDRTGKKAWVNIDCKRVFLKNVKVF